MRELKFRQLVNGKWHYWGFIEGAFIGPADIDSESQQFTGLRDKNGKEIFEGDIVKASIFNYGGKGKVKEWIDEVAWDDEWACFWLKRDRQSDWYRVECEVLGNIHENPELLEARP